MSVATCICGHPANDHGWLGEGRCLRPNGKGHYCDCHRFVRAPDPHKVVNVWNGESWYTSTRPPADLRADGTLVGEPAHFRWAPVDWGV